MQFSPITTLLPIKTLGCIIVLLPIFADFEIAKLEVLNG